MAYILCEISGLIGTITLNHPEKRNALSEALIEEFLSTLEEMQQQKVRVIILRAPKGCKVWSAGHDVRELPMPGRDPLTFNDPLLTIIRKIQYLPIPVIALIEGEVWGGACDLAISCDMLMGCPQTSLTMTPAKIGVPYNVSGILHFINLMPINIVREMFFTANPMTAETAYRLGILNCIMPVDELEKHTYQMAEQICKNSPLSISAIKEQIRLLASAFPLAPHMFEHIQSLRRKVYDSQDYKEGIKAFFEKRPPVFTGE